MSDREVIRPSVPPLWWASLGLWAGVWLAESLVWRAFVQAKGPLSALACSIALCAAALVSAMRRRPSALLVVGLSVGVVCGSLAWWSWVSTVRALDRSAPSIWHGQVVSDAQNGAFGESSTVRVWLGARRALVRVGWPRGEHAPEAGSECTFFGSYRAPSGDERGRRSFRSGVTGSVSARQLVVEGNAPSLRGFVRPWRRRWLARIAEVPGDGGALLAGVVLGERSRMAGTSAEAAFRTTGLTHLVAVSGGHLVVVAALAAWLLGRVRAPRLAALAVVLAITGIYVVISGVQPSAVRAWLMSAVLLLSSLSGRRADGIASLAGAVWLALVYSPMAAFDLGMQLSVLSVAGLLVFARLAERWVAEATPAFAGGLASPVALTLVAQAVTVPLTAAVFGMLSLVAPLANLVVSPIVSVLLVVGIGGLGLTEVAGSAGVPVLKFAGLLGELGVWCAERMAALPHAAVPLGWAAGPASLVAALCAAALWLVWPRPSARRARTAGVLAVAALLAVAAGPPPRQGTEIVVLDVGQGDAILVRDGSHAVLVDAGPDEQALRTALLRQGVRHLDAVVITHLHDDHYGGLEALEGVIAVERVLVPSGSLAQKPEICERFERVSAAINEVDAGDLFTVGRWRIVALWPQGAAPDVATNEASVVLAVRYGSFDALLTGDAESGVLDSVIASGGIGDIEALKVGHHGSAEAVSVPVLGVLRPEYALISVGAGNRFGHPVTSTLDELTTAGSRIVRTDESGDIVVRTDGSRFGVTEARTRR